jgi:hypothetical protein
MFYATFENQALSFHTKSERDHFVSKFSREDASIVRISSASAYRMTKIDHLGIRYFKTVDSAAVTSANRIAANLMGCC